MLLELYLEKTEDIDIYDMPGLFQSIIILFLFLLGVGISIIDIISFPIEFIIWYIDKNIF